MPCTEPHAAQLVRRGTFADDTAYPGLEALASRMNLLCTDPTYIDYTLTAGITDLQFAASYAATSSEWADGHHDYFCFVNRTSGEPLHRNGRDPIGGSGACAAGLVGLQSTRSATLSSTSSGRNG